MRVELSFFKSLSLLHSLKIERALHAPSFNGLPRIRPLAPDAAINAGIRQRCRECPVCSSSSFCLGAALRKTRQLERVQGDRLQ